MLLGYSTWGMPTVPIEMAVRCCAALGFDSLELTVCRSVGEFPNRSAELDSLDGPARQRIRQLYEAHGLKLPAVAGHTPLLVADPAAVRASMDRLKRTIDLCADLAGPEGPPALNTTTGGRPDQWEAVRETLAERSAELADYAARRGVMVALEPHVGAALDRPERALWLLQRVGSPYLRLNFDISHFNVVGIPIEDSVPALAPLSVHTHVKDETFRPVAEDEGAPDPLQRPYLGQARDPQGRLVEYRFLVPGEGVFDYGRYLRAMHVAGYRGAITVEISVQVQRRPGYDPLAAAAQSYRVLQDAFWAAGVPRG